MQTLWDSGKRTNLLGAAKDRLALDVVFSQLVQLASGKNQAILFETNLRDEQLVSLSLPLLKTNLIKLLDRIG